MKRSIQRKCAHCGKDFTATNPLRIYCSKRCNDRATYARNHECHGRAKKICLVCGKEYTPHSNQQKYCGADCAKQAQKNQTLSWRTANAELVHSRTIKYNRDYRARRGKRYARKPLQEIACRQCGEVFMQIDPKQKYCSVKCQRAWHHRPENRTKPKDKLAWLETATRGQMEEFLKKLFG